MGSFHKKGRGRRSLKDMGLENRCSWILPNRNRCGSPAEIQTESGEWFCPTHYQRRLQDNMPLKDQFLGKVRIPLTPQAKSRDEAPEPLSWKEQLTKILDLCKPKGKKRGRPKGSKNKPKEG